MPLQTTLSNSFANVLGWKWFYQQQKKEGKILPKEQSTWFFIIKLKKVKLKQC